MQHLSSVALSMPWQATMQHLVTFATCMHAKVCKSSYPQLANVNRLCQLHSVPKVSLAVQSKFAGIYAGLGLLARACLLLRVEDARAGLLYSQYRGVMKACIAQHSSRALPSAVS